MCIKVGNAYCTAGRRGSNAVCSPSTWAALPPWYWPAPFGSPWKAQLLDRDPQVILQ